MKPIPPVRREYAVACRTPAQREEYGERAYSLHGPWVPSIELAMEKSWDKEHSEMPEGMEWFLAERTTILIELPASDNSRGAGASDG